MNEQEKFLADLDNTSDQGIDVFDAPLEHSEEEHTESEPEEEVTSTTDDTSDEEEEEILGIRPRNRKERRKLERLAADRESASYLAGKLEARTEAERSLSTEEKDYLKGIESIYGTESPEAKIATDLLKKAIIGAKDDAKREALEEWQSMRDQESAEEAEAQDTLDSFIEDIEDEYKVNLSEAQQRGYFQLLQKMSPKDRQGNVIEYADPHAVWEVYEGQMKSKASPNRAKTLSSRSMTQSGATQGSSLQSDSTFRFLSENDII